MRSFFLAAIVLLLVLFPLAGIPAYADWPPLSPQDLAMTSAPRQPGAPAIILLREETDNDVQHYHSVYMRIKVLTEAGRRYGDVELPYEKSEARFSIDSISGRTVHSDGTVIPFQGKVFEKAILKGRGVKRMVKAFTLPDVQVGSVVDYKYSLRYADNYAVPPEWTVQEDLYQVRAEFSFVPFRKDLVLAHGRIGNGVAWTSFLPAQYKVEERPTPISYSVVLVATDVAPMIEEPYMPPERVLRWRVRFYYQSGPNKDYWKDESKFWVRDVEDFLSKKKGISEALATIVAAADTPEQKLKKVHGFIQQLENRSYIPARQTQEVEALGIKGNAGVEDVLRQKSGTHDDLNRLFAAFAREMGLPANMMLVPSRDENFFDEAFLSMNQFDAEIVMVNLDGKDLYFDPGSKYCPYGLLDWRYSGSKGMRQGSGKGPEWAEAPSPTFNQAMIKRVAKLKLTEEGKVEGLLGVGFFGLEGMIRRQSAGKTDAEGRKKALEDEIKGWLPGGSEVTMTQDPPWNETETPFVVQFKVSAPVAVSAGRKVVLPTHIFQMADKPMFSAGQRVNPVYLYYPTRQVDDIRITLPTGWAMDSLPAPRSVKLAYAAYYAADKLEDNTIVATRDLAMAGMAFPVTEYAGVKSFYEQVKAGDDSQVILKDAARAAGN